MSQFWGRGTPTISSIGQRLLQTKQILEDGCSRIGIGVFEGVVEIEAHPRFRNWRVAQVLGTRSIKIDGCPGSLLETRETSFYPR
jgi:hypothetical protein